jgi:hypothetical protein
VARKYKRSVRRSTIRPIDEKDFLLLLSAARGAINEADRTKEMVQEAAALGLELYRRLVQATPDAEKARASRRGAVRGGILSGRERRRGGLTLNEPLYQAWEVYHHAQPGHSPEAFARQLASDRAPIFNQFAPPGDQEDRIRALGAVIRRYEKKK